MYKPVGGNTVWIYHKYILYTNSAGEEFYARGGPGVTTEPGTIITESGPYKEKTVDWDKSRDPGSTATPHPRETIKEGDNLSPQWEKIKETVKGVDDKNIPYDLKDSNSNATVDEALREAGLPAPTMDGPTDNWSPGSDFDLPGGDVPAPIPLLASGILFVAIGLFTGGKQ